MCGGGMAWGLISSCLGVFLLAFVVFPWKKDE